MEDKDMTARELIDKTKVKTKESWNDLSFKNKLMYSSAIVCLLTGLTLCSVDFALTMNIAGNVLGMLGIVLTYAGSIFGISTHYNNKLQEFESKVISELK